jgi:uncharacterized protein
MSLLEVCVAVAIAIGLVGILFPILPGSILILGAIGVWSFQIGGATAWTVFAVATVLLVAGTVVKYAVPGKQMKTSGVPNSTLLIGAVCAVAGFFIVPVIGILVGFIVGVYAAELRRLGTQQAWPSTKTAIKAVGVSIAIEFAAALLATAAWGVGVATTS